MKFKPQFIAVFSAIGVAAGAMLAIPGPAQALPKITPHTAGAGKTVTYNLNSDSGLNIVSFYDRTGKVVTKQVRFLPDAVSIGTMAKYHKTMQFRTKEKQKVGVQVSSYNQQARCEVQVNGVVVDSAIGTAGFANC